MVNGKGTQVVNRWEAKLPGTKRGTNTRKLRGLGGGDWLGIGEGIEPVLSFGSATVTHGQPASWLCV